MNIKKNINVLIPVIILATLLIVGIISLSYQQNWINLFKQSSVSWWGILGVVGGYLLFSGLTTYHFFNSKNTFSHLWAISLILILFWLLYSHVLSTWWAGDDPWILLYVHNVNPWNIFFERIFFYTPLQAFSYWLDYYWFGFQPEGFYWHHLLSFSIALLLVYWVLQQFFSPLIASMIMALFVASVPIAQHAHYLAVRHYVEGLGFAALATGAYLYALNNTSYRIFWIVISSVSYLIACLAKEIYIPLPLILFILPKGTVQQRIVQLLPLLLSFTLYAGLRAYSLSWDWKNAFVSSYKDNRTEWHDILNFPSLYLKNMGWQDSWYGLPMITILAILPILFWKRPHLSFLGAVWLVATLAPLTPILKRLVFSKYYLILPTLLSSFTCGLIWSQLQHWIRNPILYWGILNIWFITILFANILPNQIEQTQLYTEKHTRQMTWEFLLNESHPQAVLIDDYHSTHQFVALREKLGKSSLMPGWCPIIDCDCISRFPNHTAWLYVNGQWQTQSLVSNECSNERKNAELWLRITLTSTTNIHWQLGPYTETQGKYYVWMKKETENFDMLSAPAEVNSTGEVILREPLTPSKVIIKFQSTEGWYVYSPPIIIDPKAINEKGIVEINWQNEIQ